MSLRAASGAESQNASRAAIFDECAARVWHRAQDDHAVVTMARLETVDEAIGAAERRRPFMAGEPAPVRGRG